MSQCPSYVKEAFPLQKPANSLLQMSDIRMLQLLQQSLNPQRYLYQFKQISRGWKGSHPTHRIVKPADLTRVNPKTVQTQTSYSEKTNTESSAPSSTVFRNI